MAKQKPSKKQATKLVDPLNPNSAGGAAIPSHKMFSKFVPLPLGGFSYVYHYLNEHVQYLNNSKFFAGVIMILLNVGSKFISIQFSKSTEEYMKMSLSKQILVFAMAWMGTRDIITALILTGVFVILSEHIFNEESPYCMVPHQHRILHKLADTNDDGAVSEEELAAAIQVLEKTKKKTMEDNRKKLQEESGGTGGPVW